MSKEPTLAECRYFAVHGKLPSSLRKQGKTVEKTAEKAPAAEETFPRETGGGWFILSNGKKVQNRERAEEMQAALDEEIL